MIVPNYTAIDVRAYRDQHSCSMMEAKAYFHKKQLQDMINEVRLKGDAKLLVDVVEELLNNARF